MLTTLPQLYSDLTEGNLNTLQEYHMPYSFQTVKQLSAIEQQILRTCKRAVADLATQTGWEYRFGIESSAVGFEAEYKIKKVQEEIEIKGKQRIRQEDHPENP